MNSSPELKTRPVVVRLMKKTDIDKAVEIIYHVAKDEQLIGLSPALLNKEKTLAVLQKLLNDKNSIAFVAEHNNEIVGTAFAASPQVEESKNVHFGLCLLKEARGQGIGNLLTDAIINWCIKTEKEKILLSVLEDNTRAVQLYKKFGFEPLGRKKAAFLDKDRYLKEIIMQKTLK